MLGHFVNILPVQSNTSTSLFAITLVLRTIMIILREFAMGDMMIQLLIFLTNCQTKRIMKPVFEEMQNIPPHPLP